jgi:hypothetical protein
LGGAQTERIVGFVSEAVAALGDVRVSVGIATGPAAVAIEVLPVPPSPCVSAAASVGPPPLGAGPPSLGAASTQPSPGPGAAAPSSPGAAAPPSPGAAADTDAGGLIHRSSSSSDSSQEALCRYTASGPAVEAAQRLELAGRPGFMHLSLAAADRLGAERGLFLDLANAAAPAGPGGEGGGSAAAAAAAAAAARRRAEGGRGLRHDRSVWIDCFHADVLLTAEDLAAAAEEAAAEVVAAAAAAAAASFAAATDGGLAALPEEDAADADMDP